MSISPKGDFILQVCNSKSTTERKLCQHIGLRIILILLCIILTIIAIGLVIASCVKLQKTQELYENLRLNYELNFKNLDEAANSPDYRLKAKPQKEIEVEHSEPKDKEKNRSRDKAIIVRGDKSHLTYPTNTKKESMLIKNWILDHAGSSDSPYFRLSNPSTITIEKSGLYTVEAQLTWRRENGQSKFSVLNSTGNLAQCVSAFTLDYATLQTCFTATTTHLKKGDKISVVIETDAVTVDFDSRKSFLAIHFMSEDI